ncbi:hypothetical protein D3C79_362440 [compost metagenome]
MENADRQQRPRVRRHQAVDHGEAGQQRNADLDQRHPRAPGDDEHQRNQQYEADFEEQRDAHQKCGEHHCPVHVLLAEGTDERLCDLVGTAGVGHQLAEHGAEGEHDTDEAEHAAEAVLERFHDLGHRHPGGQAKKACREGQGDEGVDLEMGDQHDQPDDGDQCVEQQEGISSQSEHGGNASVLSLFLCVAFSELQTLAGVETALSLVSGETAGSGDPRQAPLTVRL